MDGGLKLKHTYAITNNQLKALAAQNKVYLKDIYSRMDNNYSLVFLEDKTANSLHGVRYIKPGEEKDEYIFNTFRKNWNADNFGPVIVPSKNYFLLGDNRNNALDSRYLGFTKQEDVVGTALKGN